MAQYLILIPSSHFPICNMVHELPISYNFFSRLVPPPISYPSSSGRSGLLLKFGNLVALLQAHCHLVLRSHGNWGGKELSVKPKINIRAHTRDRSSYKTVIKSTTVTHLTSTFGPKTEKDCACVQCNIGNHVE